MKVSVEGKKIVVYDIIGPHARENMTFDKTVARNYVYRMETAEKWKAVIQRVRREWVRDMSYVPFAHKKVRLLALQDLVRQLQADAKVSA